MATKSNTPINNNEFAGKSMDDIRKALKAINPDLTSAGGKDKCIARIQRARAGATVPTDWLKGKAPNAIKVANGSALKRPEQVPEDVWDSNPNLRTACKAAGLPAVGKTPDLQQRLFDFHSGKDVPKKTSASPKNGKTFTQAKEDITALNNELGIRLTLKGDTASLINRYDRAVKYFKNKDKTIKMQESDFLKGKCPPDVLNQADQAEEAVEEHKDEAPEQDSI